MPEGARHRHTLRRDAEARNAARGVTTERAQVPYFMREFPPALCRRELPLPFGALLLGALEPVEQRSDTGWKLLLDLEARQVAQLPPIRVGGDEAQKAAVHCLLPSSIVRRHGSAFCLPSKLVTRQNGSCFAAAASGRRRDGKV